MQSIDSILLQLSTAPLAGVFKSLQVMHLSHPFIPVLVHENSSAVFDLSILLRQEIPVDGCKYVWLIGKALVVLRGLMLLDCIGEDVDLIGIDASDDHVLLALNRLHIFQQKLRRLRLLTCDPTADDLL